MDIDEWYQLTGGTMNDTEFMKLDEELYTAIQNVINKFDGLKEFEINADSDVFNSYCELRNVISNKRGDDD